MHKNAEQPIRTNESVESFYAISWSVRSVYANDTGEYIEKSFQMTMIIYTIFQTPIPAATTYAASNNGRFIVVCNLLAVVLQRIATENSFFMAILTRLETANRPGRGWSVSLQSHFYSLIFYYLVRREHMLLHMITEIAESLLQSFFGPKM